MNFTSLHDFLAMGGYAAYVWPAYAVFLAVLLADSLAPSENSKLLMGITAFTIGQMAATEAGKAKSCPLAKEAQEAFVTAQINLPMGANVAKEAVTQYMQYLQQFTPVVDNQVKQFCK